jgi:hypothetical protein
MFDLPKQVGGRVKSKIACLPGHLRDELNRRLRNNEPGLRLLDWLNRLPEVQAVLAHDFAGRPINGVNLTHWKAGPYRQWRLHQKFLKALDLYTTGRDPHPVARAARLTLQPINPASQ